MTNRYTAEETLHYIIEHLMYYLEELKEIRESDSNQFAFGEKFAYIECLEMIKNWEKADNNGLNIDIEVLYL